MHRIGSYAGERSLDRWREEIARLIASLRDEPRDSRREIRRRITTLALSIAVEQERLGRILGWIERDWDLYLDRVALTEYYERLTGLYLSIGGHWAGVQESGELYALTRGLSPQEEGSSGRRENEHGSSGNTGSLRGIGADMGADHGFAQEVGRSLK